MSFRTFLTNFLKLALKWLQPRQSPAPAQIETEDYAWAPDFADEFDPEEIAEAAVQDYLDDETLNQEWCSFVLLEDWGDLPRGQREFLTSDGLTWRPGFVRPKGAKFDRASWAFDKPPTGGCVHTKANPGYERITYADFLYRYPGVDLLKHYRGLIKAQTRKKALRQAASEAVREVALVGK